MQRSLAQRLACLVILFLSVFAVTSEAQSRLNFPRVLSANELSTTGFALVNTSSATVVATFSFYDSDGKLVEQTPLSVPAKGQVAKLASEIFSTAKSSTWIQVSSASTELQGFELVGDFQSLVDGGGPAAESTQLAVIDFSKEDLINVVNPGSQAATVQLTLNGANGQTLTTKSFPLAPFQPMSFRLGDLNNDDNIDLVSISANVAVSATLMTKLPGGADIGVTNATPVSSAPTTLLFPFAPTGPQGASNWKTLLGIANVGTTSQTVSITYNPDGGAPVTVQRNLATNATVGDAVDSLFSLSLNTFSAGWIRVTGAGPLAGAAAYQDSASGSLAVVPPQSAGATRFFFGHIASLSPWYTGIGLLNATTTAADVEVYAIDGSGKSVAAPASFSLPANTRRTALLSEFVPQVLQRASDGGWVFLRTTNNVPLLGFELFGHSVFPVLANVQGFALPSTSTFTPPLGPDSVLGLTVTQVTFTDGISARFQFKPSDLIDYVATIVNSGAATGAAKVRFTVLDPGNQTMLSSEIPISLKAGAADVVFPGIIPKNALTGSYTVIATLTYQGQVAANAGSFDVTGGASLRTVDQSVPSVFLTSDLTQTAFRPGDIVTVIIPIANFTAQSAPATITYKLTGPGNSSAGSGNLTFTAPPGISFQIVDTLQIPNSAPQGLYAFSSVFAGGGTTSTQTVTLTVVPKSSGEGITLENVYVTDSAGIPQGGFVPGSNAQLYSWRLSTFPTNTPANVHYTVTGPNSSSVLDQPLDVKILTGGSLGSIPLALSSSAVAGNYTFQATITYQDSNFATKTSTMSAPFIVGAAPTPLKETLATMHPFVLDLNFVDRMSFSPGEPLLLNRAVYSTFASSTTGTVRYQISGPPGLILDGVVNATFAPGMNVSFAGVSTSVNIPTGHYTLTTTVTAGGQSTANFTTFDIAGAAVPSFSLTSEPTTSGMIQIDGKLRETPLPVDKFVNDGSGTPVAPR